MCGVVVPFLCDVGGKGTRNVWGRSPARRHGTSLPTVGRAFRPRRRVPQRWRWESWRFCPLALARGSPAAPRPDARVAGRACGPPAPRRWPSWRPAASPHRQPHPPGVPRPAGQPEGDARFASFCCLFSCENDVFLSAFLVKAAVVKMAEKQDSESSVLITR